MSSYQVAEHRPVWYESLQLHTEQSSRPLDQDQNRVEADVYVWRYALLVVHARKEEETGLLATWPVIKTGTQQFRQQR